MIFHSLYNRYILIIAYLKTIRFNLFYKSTHQTGQLDNIYEYIYCVIDAPNNGNLNLWGTNLALSEGRTGTWTCSVTHSNPASTLIWRNDTDTFMPSSPAVVTKASVKSLLLFYTHIENI